MTYKCADCELCGRQVEADLMCTIVVEEDKLEKACWCVCKDCKEKFIEKIDRPYMDQVGEDKEILVSGN